ncbi:MAG: DUF2017 family protein [Actinobacteria bacterium]|nr:DUF2017 family protein [Actinomycetota bacterium]
MFAFTATSAGYASRLDTSERAVLTRVVEDVAILVADGEEERGDDDDPIAHLDFEPAGAGERPDGDPALARLFPPMSVSDPDLAAEMRGLTVDEVRRSKLANLAVVARALASGSETVLVRRGEELQWLAALTDVRLVLASRLGIDDDADSRRVHDLAVASAREDSSGGDDERLVALASLYAGLTWWQESLLLAVSRDRRAI